MRHFDYSVVEAVNRHYFLFKSLNWFILRLNLIVHISLLNNPVFFNDNIFTNWNFFDFLNQIVNLNDLFFCRWNFNDLLLFQSNLHSFLYYFLDNFVV